jgi:hypothetical protein
MVDSFHEHTRAFLQVQARAVIIAAPFASSPMDAAITGQHQLVI